MWPFGKRTKAEKQCQSIEGLAENCPLFEVIQGLSERTLEHNKDIAILNTGVGRIEKKQNRWLEILNDRELLDATASGKPPPGNGGPEIPNPEPVRLAGEPTEE